MGWTYFNTSVRQYVSTTSNKQILVRPITDNPHKITPIEIIFNTNLV